MTLTEFKKKIASMLREDGGIKNVILNTCVNAMVSNYAKTTFLKNADDNFVLPKSVLSAVFAELAYQYEPLTKSDKATCKRIKPLVSIRSGKK